MINFKSGDIFASDCLCWVNPTNVYGVNGRGLALEFANRFKDACAAYTAACKSHRIYVGRPWMYDNGLLKPQWIAFLPTKTHWSSPSALEYVVAGARALESECRRLDIASCAVPALGCGLGQLDWLNVKEILSLAFRASEVKFDCYPPL